jgi:hypothetical protein
VVNPRPGRPHRARADPRIRLGVSLGAPLTSFTASIGSKVSVFKITT